MCDWSSCELGSRTWQQTVAFESVLTCVSHPRNSWSLAMML